MRRTFRIPPLALYGLPLLAFLILAGTSAWVCDDAFIAFRYSRNLAEGSGLRYNPGVEPPVEGYTQLGWVLWIAIFEKLGLDPALWARVSGIAAGATLLTWVLSYLRRRLEIADAASVVAALFLATTPTFVLWASGGLGTMFFALAIFATWERLLGDPERPRSYQAGLAAFATALLRADGIYWLGLICALALVRAWRQSRRDLYYATILCGSAAAAEVALQLTFRLSYHGDWLPNTVRAKVGMSLPLIERGFDYLATYWLTIPSTLVVLVLALPLALRRRTIWLWSCVVLAAATFFYGVVIGGDFMAMGRFYLPAMPFLAIAVAELLNGLERRLGLTAVGCAGLLLLVGSLPARFDMHLTPRAWREANHVRWSRDYETEYAFWQGMQDRSARWGQIGRAMRLHCEKSDSIVRVAIGAIGYFSRIYIYDRAGLVNREVALLKDPEVYAAGRHRRPGDPALRMPRHDRIVQSRFFAKYDPTYEDATVVFNKSRPELLEAQPLSLVHPIGAEQGFPKNGFLVLTPFSTGR